jgi:hypothetical protein
MNRNQLIAMWSGVAALTGACIYPPLLVQLEGWGFGSTPTEWGWLWQSQSQRGTDVLGLNLPILGIEAMLIALITVALIVSFRDRRSN